MSSDAALRRQALQWLAQGRTARVIEVLRHRGSVPRHAGARMLLAADGASLGTIGGGQLEWQALERARRRLAAGDRGTHEVDVALGPSLGQCCGGALALRDAPLDAAALERWPVPAPLFSLQLYGAGHVGQAVVRLLADIDCRVQWIDQRDGAFAGTAGLPPHIERIDAEPVEAEVATAPPGAWLLVMTHRHDLDLAICAAALKRPGVDWIGLIGSATKRARFEHRLAERGIAPGRLAALECPVGIAGIGGNSGKQPAVIAVSIVARLLQRAG